MDNNELGEIEKTIRGIPNISNEQVVQTVKELRRHISGRLESAETNAKKDEARETREYRQSDLDYKRRSLYVSILGFTVVAIALFLNWNQSHLAQKTLRNSVQQSMVKLTLDLDKLYIDKPRLRPYFYHDTIPKEEELKIGDADRAEVYATAIMVLDVLDLAAAQSVSFREQWDTPEAWDEWVIDQLAESSILRQVLHDREKWYGNNLKELAKKAEAKLKNKQSAGQSERIPQQEKKTTPAPTTTSQPK